MRKIAARRNKLVEIIKSRGMLPVKTLSEMIGVSEMTIRRDLRDLEKETIISDNEPEYNLISEIEKSNEQKDKIGKFAASLINLNDNIIIDTGSTTAKILPYLPPNHNLTILCYNYNILSQLVNKSDINILFSGGYYHKNTEMFESDDGLRFISRFRANKVFLSAAGVHRQLGVTCANNYEIPTKQAIIASSQEKILVVDSSKFDSVRSSYMCELNDVDTIITNKQLSSTWKEYIMSIGIKLHLV